MNARRRSSGFFRVIRFDKTLKGSRNAIRYVAYRSEDVQGKTPCIFDDRSDTADVKRFMRELEDPVTRHQTAVKAYHTLFSLSRRTFERAGLTDFREEVREVMRTYELETGRKLEWIASFHDNPTHPHCHVIIKAAYVHENGQHKKLFLNRNEVQRIKEITGRVMEARLPTLERPAPVRTGSRGNEGMAWAVGSVFQWLEQRIKEERRRRQREEEDRYRRWLEDQDRDDRGR